VELENGGAGTRLIWYGVARSTRGLMVMPSKEKRGYVVARTVRLRELGRELVNGGTGSGGCGCWREG
jgi:hypothetical protein